MPTRRLPTRDTPRACRLASFGSSPAFATGGLRPDLTILLDLPVEAGLARKAGQETRFEQAFDVDYHRRVRAGFLALAAAEPGRFTVVDAAQEPDAVTRDVLAAVDRLPVPGRTA